MLKQAYRRALAVARLNRVIGEARDDAVETAESAEVPRGLRERVKEALHDGSDAWDRVLYDIAAEEESKSFPGKTRIEFFTFSPTRSAPPARRRQ